MAKLDEVLICKALGDPNRMEIRQKRRQVALLFNKHGHHERILWIY